jgi:hypothetical protein
MEEWHEEYVLIKLSNKINICYPEEKGGFKGINGIIPKNRVDLMKNEPLLHPTL